MNWTYLYKHVFLACVLSMYVILSNAQVKNVDRNLKYVDSVTEDLRNNFCNKIFTYPDNVKIDRAKKEKFFITFLNQIFNKEFTDKEFELDILKIKKAKVYKVVKQNGLIKTYEIVINGNYLRVELDLDFIDGIAYRKRCLLNTTSKARCGESAIRFVDFKLFKEAFLKEIDFPVFFFDNAIAGEAFALDVIQRASFRNTNYRFSIPVLGDTSKLNKILGNQYKQGDACCYNYTTPPADFVTLIEKDAVDVVKNLIFSPNYFYSINAMEAFIYLNSINKVQIDELIAERIKIIKGEVFEITIQKTNDLYSVVEGYKGIKTSDDAVVQKYANYLSKRKGM